MSLAVVRCPACHGESHLDSAALGLLVQCPRCDTTFIAVQEPEVSVPVRAPRNPTLPPTEPPRPSRRQPRYEIDPEQTADPNPLEDHDPHRHPAEPLPASVLIGLALLPFAIPILWVLAPLVVGERPVLSIATAIALAISASALSLAVIYTIDWTPATRVKGVLMLVALTYFAAVSLYFMKQEMVAKIKKATGWDDGTEWEVFHPLPGDYQVKMPGRPIALNDGQSQPFPTIARLSLVRSFLRMPLHGSFAFTVGSSPDNEPIKMRPGWPQPNTNEWFDRLTREIFKQSRGKSYDENSIEYKGFNGREVRIQISDGEAVRIVRVYLIRGRLYYLSVEGLGVDSTADPAKEFFDSFLANAAED